MSFILDTSVLIELENGNMNVIKALESSRPSDTQLYITIFSFTECYYGHIRKNQKNRDLALNKLKMYKLLNTTEETGIEFCKIMNDLTIKGKPIPEIDAFIAAIAKENKMKLVTSDKHFKNVEGLDVLYIALT